MVNAKISHIYFSGGGLKGMCFLGILRYLYIENMMENIKHCAGTSIGAYFGTILALKIPIDYIEKELSMLLDNLNSRKQTDLILTKENISRLFINNGLSSPAFFLAPIRHFLQETYNTDDITFIEIAKRTGINLYINTININTGISKVFSLENTPNASVLNAILASISVPFLYEPVLIDNEYYIDGITDYVDFFKDVNKEYVLYIKLCRMNHEKPVELPKSFGFMAYSMRVIEIIVNSTLILEEKHKDVFYVMKIKELPYESTFRFKYTDTEIIIDFTQDDLDNLILKGFIDITNYMNTRYICTEV